MTPETINSIKDGLVFITEFYALMLAGALLYGALLLAFKPEMPHIIKQDYKTRKDWNL